MIPKCLVLCSNCLDDHPVNTRAHRRSDKASVPFERAEFVSWPGFWECGCNPAVRAMNFIGDAELAKAWEFQRGEESIHNMVRRGEVDGRNLLEECVSFGGLAHACLIGVFFGMWNREGSRASGT